MQQISFKFKRELLIFVMITYGLAFLMGIPMALFFYAGKDISYFSSAQMFYPAAGLMLAKLVYERENSLLPKRFFCGFLTLAGVMILWCFTGLFLPDGAAKGGSSYLAISGTVVVGLLYFSEKKEKRSAYGLSGKKWGVCVRILILFVILFYGPGFLTAIFMEGLSGTKHLFCEIINQNRLFSFLGLPLAFILSAAYFLGEEYGWRIYFQPLLQKKFGLIKGVFLFGLLWEFWHLPLVCFYYAPLTSDMLLVQLIIFRYLNCILLSIFMAYAYMKTHNVWLPVLIHFLNNSLPEIGIEAVTWKMLIVLTLIKMAMYLPVLFSKVFRKQNVG